MTLWELVHESDIILRNQKITQVHGSSGFDGTYRRSSIVLGQFTPDRKRDSVLALNERHNDLQHVYTPLASKLSIGDEDKPTYHPPEKLLNIPSISRDDIRQFLSSNFKQKANVGAQIIDIDKLPTYKKHLEGGSVNNLHPQKIGSNLDMSNKITHVYSNNRRFGESNNQKNPAV